MRIILIYSPIGEITVYNTPTGLLYIGTILKENGYDIQLIDCSVESDYEKILEQEIKDTDILGIYAMSVHIRYLLPLLKRLKQIKNKLLIVWGGPHAILFPEQTAKSRFADIVCKGEGEEVMLEIVRGYESGKLDLHKINGIAFKEDGNIYSNPYREFIDMNTLPILDWSLIKKEVMNVIKNSICRVQASRGCPYPCTFCINWLTNNQKMRYRDSKNVLDEIEYLYKKYNIKRIGFRDEVFMSNKQQVKEIAQGLIDRKIKITWIGNPRCEYLRERYTDDSYLKLLVESGCDKLQFGGESGSNRILKFLRKGIKVKDILNFVRRTKKFNIIPLIAFLTGIPTETKKEQLKTLRLIRDIKHIYPEAFINGPANFRPYPGGELYDLCVNQYSLKMPQSLEEWATIDVLGGTRPPWIKKMHLNTYLWFSVAATTFKTEFLIEKMHKNLLRFIGLLVFSIVSKFRLRYVFYLNNFCTFLFSIVYTICFPPKQRRDRFLTSPV